ncbi:F-box protein SKIP31 [Hibiscus syriacus]|uniref:F-box protein SKIP31 n=1 Tax=Hibiscus syriacus TaxID=106335 RepID=A0A6A2XIZ7_HIBSY|nr:F-box protein SKIP31 [Hibiscus syriacus]
MIMEKRYLDCILVPTGILFMVAYHLWLLYRILNHPTRTVIGVNAINRRFWVQAMMEDASKNGVLAVQTLRNNIMASTLLASTAIMLSSLIAVLMTSGSANRSSWFIFGDTSDLAFSIKFFSILCCFLVAFLLNLQSIRYYSHASILINVPVKKMSHRHRHLTEEYVANTVNRGSYFCSGGPLGPSMKMAATTTRNQATPETRATAAAAALIRSIKVEWNRISHQLGDRVVNNGELFSDEKCNEGELFHKQEILETDESFAFSFDFLFSPMAFNVKKSTKRGIARSSSTVSPYLKNVPELPS